MIMWHIPSSILDLRIPWNWFYFLPRKRTFFDFDFILPIAKFYRFLIYFANKVFAKIRRFLTDFANEIFCEISSIFNLFCEFNISWISYLAVRGTFCVLVSGPRGKYCTFLLLLHFHFKTIYLFISIYKTYKMNIKIWFCLRTDDVNVLFVKFIFWVIHLV